jgi:phage FluMu gp28-like protein
MEEKKVRLPDTDLIRNSFRSVKKMVTDTGQARFDAVHDERHGHADHWWAYCLAESAITQPVSHPGDWGGVPGRPITAGLLTEII